MDCISTPKEKNTNKKIIMMIMIMIMIMILIMIMIMIIIIITNSLQQHCKNNFQSVSSMLREIRLSRR